MVINDERISASCKRRLDRRRNSVIAALTDFENCRPVEQRLYGNFAFRPFRVPQLQLPAVFMLPVFIEINNQRNTPQKPGFVGCVAITMNIEFGSCRHQAVSAALQIWVRQQPPDSRHLGEKIEKSGGVQKSCEPEACLPQ